MEDVNPADDPNNQGEDEFEEAEQEREENLLNENEENKQTSQKQEHPGMEEHLVVSKGKGLLYLPSRKPLREHSFIQLLCFCTNPLYTTSMPSHSTVSSNATFLLWPFQ